MAAVSRISSRAIQGLAAIALSVTACSSIPTLPTANVTAAQSERHGLTPSGSQDLYIGNILGGVLLYSTGKNPHQVGITNDELPRVTGVWVDQAGILYAFTDNPTYPYETVEEFKPDAKTPFFSLTLQHYGSIVAADSHRNVYAQGANDQNQQAIDVYPPGKQAYAHEYIVPSIGRVSAAQGMAFDERGTLLVGVAALASNRQDQVGAVFSLDKASGKFVNLNLKKAYGGLIAIDKAQNLYVGGGTVLSVYAPGSTSPSRVIHTTQTIVTLTVSSDGTLYVDTYNGGISVYAPGKDHPANSFLPQAQVSGLALGPQ